MEVSVTLLQLIYFSSEGHTINLNILKKCPTQACKTSMPLCHTSTRTQLDRDNNFVLQCLPTTIILPSLPVLTTTTSGHIFTLENDLA